jgi:hypothetical protein
MAIGLPFDEHLIEWFDIIKLHWLAEQALNWSGLWTGFDGLICWFASTG